MATAIDAAQPAPLSPEAVDHALLNYQRELDTPALNNILINFQLERLVWLRAREAEQEAPIPSIDSTVRTVDSLLKRRERIERNQAPSDEATDEQEHGMLVTEEEFRRMVGIYAENAYGPQDPDESPEKTAVRTSMRRSLGLPDGPDEEEKRMFPGAHNVPEPASSTEATETPASASLSVHPEREAVEEPALSQTKGRTPRQSTSDAAPIDAPTVPSVEEVPASAAEPQTLDDAQAQPDSNIEPEPQELVPIELPSYVPPWFNDPNVDYMEKRRWLKGRSGIATFDFGSALAKARRGRSTFDSS